MQKSVLFKHGVSVNGELQVYRVDQIVKDGKILTETNHSPYSPADTKNMEGFDQKSINIVAVIDGEKVKVDFVIEKQEPTGIGLEEIIKYDRMVDDFERIAVRRITLTYDDGVEISKKYHRSWIMPGDDPNGADVISKALAIELHTPEVIELYKKRTVELETNRI